MKTAKDRRKNRSFRWWVWGSGVVLVAGGGGVLSGSAFAFPKTAVSPASSAALAEARRLAVLAPDPPVTTTKRKWLYDVHYRQGTFSVGPPTLLEKNVPTSTPRLLGRFAIELYVGRQLLERVRFDIPLLNDEPPGPPAALNPRKERPFPNFSAKARVHQRVEVPDVDRATSAVLIDRVTGARLPLLWMPVDGVAAASPPVSVSASSPSAPSAPSARHP